MRISQLIKELQQIHKDYRDIEVWVQWRDPADPRRHCYGERITEVRLSPIPGGDPVCTIDAKPA